MMTFKTNKNNVTPSHYSMMAFVAYVLIFVISLSKTVTISEMFEPSEYDFALFVFVSMLAFSVLMAIWDLCKDIDKLNVSKTTLWSKVFVYAVNSLVCLTLISQLMNANYEEDHKEFIQASIVDSSMFDDHFDDFWTVTHDNIGMYTRNRYTNGQKLNFIKTTSVTKITREVKVKYTAIE